MAYMKSPIAKRLCTLLLLVVFRSTLHAQLVCTNPLEYTALAEGNELINSQVKEQIDNQSRTAVLQNSIAAEFTQMRSWEQKYNKYLKDASGFASSLKASTSIYNEGARTLITLWHLKKAISSNTEGIVATMSMNNLYMETATELVSVYTVLNEAIAVGGKENMLTGAERSKMMWAINDRLRAFNRKLNSLYLSIRYYTINDIWNTATVGILDKTPQECATMSFERWRRAAKTVSKYK